MNRRKQSIGETISCCVCGKEFIRTRFGNVCCSTKCASKKYRSKNREKVKEYNRKYSIEHKEEIRERNKQNTDRNKETKRSQRIKSKILIFEHYGGCVCNCCGETNLEFLSIDHINNDGASHRRKLKESGTNLYHWIVKNNYPPGFRVLCFNCNHSMGHYGYCPHKTSGIYSKNKLKNGELRGY